MLLRVVERLAQQPCIDRILVNIDEPKLLDDLPRFVSLRDQGRVEVMKSRDSPSRSVLDSLEWANLERGPVLVTTADHALLSDSILDAFFRQSEIPDVDLTFGLVNRKVIEARFPESKRTYLRFSDGHYSGANLFLFRTSDSAKAAAFWRRVESERKRPWRIARAFGYSSLALFLTRRLDLDGAIKRVSKIIGTEVRAIRLEIAEAAVDVDKIEDLQLVRRILREGR